MAFEGYGFIIGYGIVSIILIIAASIFETQRKEFFPLRLILFLFGLFIMVKIPSTLNHFVYVNDALNNGTLNSTLVENLIRSNESISTITVRLPYIILAYLCVWFAFFYVFDWGKKIGEQGTQDWPPLRGGFFKK